MRKSIEIPGPPPRLEAEISRATAHPGGLFTLRLRAPGYRFVPGDCLAVYAPDGTTTRPYSLAGGVGEAELELLVRRIQGGVLSGWLCDRVPGDRVWITPPFGRFRPAAPEGARKVWFATGSGIAPFLSALRSGEPNPLRGFWGVRALEDTQGVPRVGFTCCVSRGETGPHLEGRITEQLSKVPLEPDIHYYACGLDAMIEEVSAWLERHGVEPSRIHSECFFTNQSAAR